MIINSTILLFHDFIIITRSKLCEPSKLTSVDIF